MRNSGTSIYALTKVCPHQPRPRPHRELIWKISPPKSFELKLTVALKIMDQLVGLEASQSHQLSALRRLSSQYN